MILSHPFIQGLEVLYGQNFPVMKKKKKHKKHTKKTHQKKNTKNKKTKSLLQKIAIFVGHKILEN